MNRIAIMQPTYLPWAGYFYLCASVDTFVYLDDVQFERRSWQSRNRILLAGREHLLTVPTSKVSRDTPIKEITVSHDIDWIESHTMKIRLAYSGYSNIYEFINSTGALMSSSSYLADINIALIEYFLKLLDIKCKTIRASELNLGGKRSEHLANICSELNATSYISPVGSREYLESDNFSRISGIEPTYSNFHSIPYMQRHSKVFIPNLSVIDVIGNCGLDFARSYVLGSRLPEVN